MRKEQQRSAQTQAFIELKSGQLSTVEEFMQRVRFHLIVGVFLSYRLFVSFSFVYVVVGYVSHGFYIRSIIYVFVCLTVCLLCLL